MTPEAQRIAIAEACGWEFRREFRNSVGGLVKEWIKKGIGSAMIWELPDYLNDLNAMHEAEKVLDERQQDVFAAALGDLTGGRQIDLGCTRINATTKILFATASQRAEAFLRTLGLWKD